MLSRMVGRSPLVTKMRRLWLLLHVKNTVEMILIMRHNTWLLKTLTGINV